MLDTGQRMLDGNYVADLTGKLWRTDGTKPNPQFRLIANRVLHPEDLHKVVNLVEEVVKKEADVSVVWGKQSAEDVEGGSEGWRIKLHNATRGEMIVDALSIAVEWMAYGEERAKAALTHRIVSVL